MNLIAAVLLLGSGTGGLLAQTPPAHYSVTALGTLGGKTSQAFAINSLGQVAGSADRADGRSHAFLYSDAKMQDLGTLGGRNSHAVSLNSAGQIVGDSEVRLPTGDTATHAFLYDHGKMQDLGTLGGEGSHALCINAAGQIVGTSDVPIDRRLEMPIRVRIFLFSNGKMQDIAGGVEGAATAINDSGQIVGNTLFKSEPGNGWDAVLGAFLIENGKLHDLGLPANQVSGAKAINASGQIVGLANTTPPDVGLPSRPRAFLYAQGTSQDIGTLGGETSRALGINNSGSVVGTAATETGVMHAFIYDGSKMLDLNSLVDAAALKSAGLTVLTSAMAINDRGQITGIATAITGGNMAFFLTPR